MKCFGLAPYSMHQLPKVVVEPLACYSYSNTCSTVGVDTLAVANADSQEHSLWIVNFSAADVA